MRDKQLWVLDMLLAIYRKYIYFKPIDYSISNMFFLCLIFSFLRNKLLIRSVRCHQKKKKYKLLRCNTMCRSCISQPVGPSGKLQFHLAPANGAMETRPCMHACRRVADQEHNLNTHIYTQQHMVLDCSFVSGGDLANKIVFENERAA